MIEIECNLYQNVIRQVYGQTLEGLGLEQK